MDLIMFNHFFKNKAINYLNKKDDKSASKVLSQLFNHAPAYELSFEKLDTHISVVRWDASQKEVCKLTLNSEITEDRLNFFCTRLILTLNLISEFHNSSLFKKISVNLNLDDTPAGPGLAFCSDSDTHSLIPDFIYLSSKGYSDLARNILKKDIPFPMRKSVAYWRGNSACLRDATHWISMPRLRLCEIALSSNHSHLFDVGLSGIAQVTDSEKNEIIKSGFFKGFSPLEDFLKYKYQIDIDGNSNSWPGLFQKLLTGGTVLKVLSAHNFRQWYYERLIPWKNYVPIETSMEDLVDKVIWLNNHQNLAQEIADNSRRLAFDLSYKNEILKSILAIQKLH